MKTTQHDKTKLTNTLIRDVVGLQKFTNSYNKHMRDTGGTEVQVQTMQRYTNGGKGYENGPPQKVCDYAARYTYAILKN